jgi:hypothetical protein
MFVSCAKHNRATAKLLFGVFRDYLLIGMIYQIGLRDFFKEGPWWPGGGAKNRLRLAGQYPRKKVVKIERYGSLTCAKVSNRGPHQ